MEFERMSKDNVAATKIKSLSMQDEKRLRRLQFEYEIMKAEGFTGLPEQMTNFDWLIMLTIDDEDYARRLQQYGVIKYEREQFAAYEAEEIKKQKELKNFLSRQSSCDSYVYFDVDLVEHRDKTLKIYQGCQGYKLGRPIVYEIQNEPLRLQPATIQELIWRNSAHVEPWDIHVTNYNSHTYRNSGGIDIRETSPFVHFHKEQTSNIFPKERLVYITQTSDNMLEDNYDDIPVFVRYWPPKFCGKEVEKLAEQQDIRHAALPLFKYIKFKQILPWFYFNIFFTQGILQDMNVNHWWTGCFTNYIFLRPEDYESTESMEDFIRSKRQSHAKTHILRPIFL